MPVCLSVCLSASPVNLKQASGNWELGFRFDSRARIAAPLPIPTLGLDLL